MRRNLMLSLAEREKLGVLVNNLSIYAMQLLTHRGDEVTTRVTYNILNVKKEEPELLQRLHELAGEQNDESPLRVVEDLSRRPADMVQIIWLVRRCLMTIAFLGHCIAQPAHITSTGVRTAQSQRLH